MNKPSPARYRTTNWSSYNASLRKRGSLLIWADKDMAWRAPRDGRPGRPPVFSDAAIQFGLSIKVLFKLAHCQTAGMVANLLRIAGLDWPSPGLSTLGRRQKILAVQVPYRRADGPLNLLVDNEALSAIDPRTMPNGIKFLCDGERQARKHWVQGRHRWQQRCIWPWTRPHPTSAPWNSPPGGIQPPPNRPLQDSDKTPKVPRTTRTPRYRPTGPLSGTALRRWDPGPSDRGHTKVIRESYGIHTPRSSLANHHPAGPDPRPKASQTAERMRNPCHGAPCTRARKPRRRSIFFFAGSIPCDPCGPFWTTAAFRLVFPRIRPVYPSTEMWPSGRRRSPAKGVGARRNTIFFIALRAPPNNLVQNLPVIDGRGQ